MPSTKLFQPPRNRGSTWHIDAETGRKTDGIVPVQVWTPVPLPALEPPPPRPVKRPVGASTPPLASSSSRSSSQRAAPSAAAPFATGSASEPPVTVKRLRVGEAQRTPRDTRDSKNSRHQGWDDLQVTLFRGVLAWHAGHTTGETGRERCDVCDTTGGTVGVYHCRDCRVLLCREHWRTHHQPRAVVHAAYQRKHAHDSLSCLVREPLLTLGTAQTTTSASATTSTAGRLAQVDVLVLSGNSATVVVLPLLTKTRRWTAGAGAGNCPDRPSARGTPFGVWVLPTHHEETRTLHRVQCVGLAAAVSRGGHVHACMVARRLGCALLPSERSEGTTKKHSNRLPDLISVADYQPL